MLLLQAAVGRVLQLSTFRTRLLARTPLCWQNCWLTYCCLLPRCACVQDVDPLEAIELELDEDEDAPVYKASSAPAAEEGG